jgi:PcfJ-like protein
MAVSVTQFTNMITPVGWPMGSAEHTMRGMNEGFNMVRKLVRPETINTAALCLPNGTVIHLDDLTPENIVEKLNSFKANNVGIAPVSCDDLESIEECDGGKRIAYKFARNTLFLNIEEAKVQYEDGSYLDTYPSNVFCISCIAPVFNASRGMDLIKTPWVKTFLEIFSGCSDIHPAYMPEYNILEKNKNLLLASESFAKVEWIQKFHKVDMNAILRQSMFRNSSHNQTYPHYKDVKIEFNWVSERLEEELSSTFYKGTNKNQLKNYLHLLVNAIKEGYFEEFKYAWDRHKVLIGNTWNIVKEIITEYNCEYKAAIDYICVSLTRQGRPFKDGNNSSVILWRDYLSMCKKMGVKHDKYPKYLVSMHDVVAYNYELKKDSYTRDAYKKMYDSKLKSLEYKTKEYAIIVPKNVSEFAREGSQLGHCVSSYVERVISGRSIIAFMRDRKDLEKSLITIELDPKNLKRVQTGGKGNRPPTEPEKEFLAMYEAEHLAKVAW